MQAVWNQEQARLGRQYGRWALLRKDTLAHSGNLDSRRQSRLKESAPRLKKVASTQEAV